MKTKKSDYVIYLIVSIILCTLVTGSFALTGYNCPSETDYRNVLSKAIVDYLTNPADSKLSDEEIKDMLNFYLKNPDVSKADCTKENIGALITIADEKIPDSVIKNLGKQAISTWSKCTACSDDTGCGSKNDLGQTCICVEADGDSADFESCTLRPVIPEPEPREPCDTCEDGTPCGKTSNSGETCECMLSTTDGRYRFCLLKKPIEPCTGCGNLKCGEQDGNGYTCECREEVPEKKGYQFCFMRRTTIPCTECVSTTERIACGEKNDKGAECVCNYPLENGGFKECRFQIGPEKSCKSDVDCASTGSAEQFCEFPTGTCGGEGKCVVKPTLCPDMDSPVCGCDGITHPNDCLRKGTGISKLYDGECGKCVSEGGRKSVAPGSPDCCEGLEAANVYSVKDGQCIAMSGGAVCIYCGNGQCGPGEDHCNCPEDCDTCTEGEIKQYQCADGTKVEWCKCDNNQWFCQDNPETQCTQTKCNAGEEKKHYCPDQTEVDWCKCTKEGKWECINSPETQCTQTECRDQKYECSVEDMPCCPGLIEIPMAESRTDGQCIRSNCGSICRPCGNGVCDEGENICNCEVDCTTKCEEGTVKYYTCPDSQEKVEWCTCVSDPTSSTEQTRWMCLDSPESRCSKGDCRTENDLCSVGGKPCCAGLKEVSYAVPTDDGVNCVAASCGSVCRPCGNGICEANENECMCPEDCPSGEECAKQGQVISVSPNAPDCCQGLQQATRYDLMDRQCMAIPGASVCINCGNGQCETGEDECNCPEDCRSCGKGDVTYYTCPDGTTVEWCKCATASGIVGWECINSPESQCQQTKCKAGELESYTCPDEEQVEWCECNANGTWDCINNPEKQCSIGSCGVGDLKYHTCPNGKKVEWCKCALTKTSTSEESSGEWECVNPPSSLC